jgi:hypothetical protein
MKRNFKILIVTLSLAIAPLFMYAGPPDPPGGGGDPGGPPVGAPVGDGIYILAALALAYASRKVYVMRTSAKAEQA